MIAYNHRIEFIPALRDDKTVSRTFTRFIKVEETIDEAWQEKYSHEWLFHSNQGRHVALYTDREFARTHAKQGWAFNVTDVATFFWKSGTKTIKFIPQKKFSQKRLEYWTLHIVLPIFFTVEEEYDFLHAGAVEIDEKAVLFVAESFGGKSTLTDFFIKKKHTLISDDKVAVYERDKKYYAVPSHPHHRPYRRKEDLGFFIENTAKQMNQIHAIYELSRIESDAPVLISELNGIEKFKTLRFSSEINLTFLTAKRFELLSCLASKVPVFRVSVPWNLNRLQEVYDAIMEHAKRFA